MARKEKIHKDFLVDTAFLLAKQEGFENVTARKLAAKAGCSTQPIFRLYENMDDLLAEVYLRAVEYYDYFYNDCQKYNREPFVDLGMAYIKFASEEKELFKLLFLDNAGSIKEKVGKSMYDILNGSSGFVTAEFAKAKSFGMKDAERVFTKVWIFIHGIACMTITGDYDLDEILTLDMLKDASRLFSVS